MITTTSSPSQQARVAAMQTVRSMPSGRLRSVDLAGPAGKLEALLNEGLPQAPFAALVCHPHPLGGGSMHNKVVYRAMKAMNAPEWGLGWPVLRFNFRGTGLSHGTHHGAAETSDLESALRWLENEYRRPIVVAGFSFGAAIALDTCCHDRSQRVAADVRAVAALGLPIRSGAAGSKTYDYSFLPHCTIPKLFLSGDRDRYTSSTELIQVAATAAPPNQVALVPGADHFFTGHLESMQTTLSEWLKEHVL
jgi:alpha/beta superfamily hydrolase